MGDQRDMTDAMEERLPAEPARWPKVIGVMSLVYAILGVLCTGSWVSMAFLSGYFMKLGGMDVEVPASIKAQAVFGGVIGLALGIMLLAGAVGTLRRRPSGVAWLKRWAILRLVMLIVGFGMTVVLASSQVRFQRDMLEAQNEKLREAGMESDRKSVV